ncbi:hypothetical protein DAPPUDRAFT_332579 [Daphnia pulex]|uniref:Uncharacterized protein n=1 Tax=Daphnia pulex TaxID=6669 RepID=E9HQB8_DAPPU|nr:hypothetical protein DAPPUDRAFT_332579 [Daphnia pulex]|eukprot:EFX66060.1 hypothetical protein DAPPUDRAFT_332579 [Daphnia pulex]
MTSEDEYKQSFKRSSNMAERRTILEKTFSLTSQQQEGTILGLHSRIEEDFGNSREGNRPVERSHHHRDYAQGQILVEGDIVEVEQNDDSTGNEDVAGVPIGVARQEIVDFTESDDETEETTSEDRDATERNPDLAA